MSFLVKLLLASALLAAPHWASAQASCGFFDPKITFADGSKACLNEFPFFQRKGLIAGQQYTDVVSVARGNSASYAITVTANAQRCPFVQYTTWNWGAFSAREALPQCQQRLKEATRQSPEMSDCGCEVLVDSGRTSLNRNQLGERLASFEHFLTTGKTQEQTRLASARPVETAAPAAPAALAESPRRDESAQAARLLAQTQERLRAEEAVRLQAIERARQEQASSERQLAEVQQRIRAQDEARRLAQEREATAQKARAEQLENERLAAQKAREEQAQRERTAALARQREAQRIAEEQSRVLAQLQEEAQRQRLAQQQAEEQARLAAARQLEAQRRAEEQARLAAQLQQEVQRQQQAQREAEEQARAAAARQQAVLREAEEKARLAQASLREAQRQAEQAVQQVAQQAPQPARVEAPSPQRPMDLNAGLEIADPTIYNNKVALVIGNAGYAGRWALKNPTNDARAVADRFKALGFDVLLYLDVKVNQLGDILSTASQRMRPGGAFVFYYAGHGLQLRNENYFPAIDAGIRTQFDVPTQSLSLQHILSLADEAKSELRLMFLDACRDNPWVVASRSFAGGLAKVEPPRGTLISYATRPGSVAEDGEGSNGVYTNQLLRHLGTPNLPVESVFKRIANDVYRTTGGRQEPWHEGNLRGEFAFVVKR